MIALSEYIPLKICENTVVPLLKNNHLNPADMCNYRAIVLSSVRNKILDYLILGRYGRQLDTCDL